MSLFDTLENEAERIGAKAGLSPEQIQSISATIQAHLRQGSSERQALEATADKYGISVEKIVELLGHAGGSDNLLSEMTGIAGGLFKG